MMGEDCGTGLLPQPNTGTRTPVFHEPPHRSHDQYHSSPKLTPLTSSRPALGAGVRTALRLIADVGCCGDRVRWVDRNRSRDGSPSSRGGATGRSGSISDCKERISTGGGTEPRWRDDGKELFFLAPDGMMMPARIDPTKEFNATVPEPLFPRGFATMNVVVR